MVNFSAALTAFLFLAASNTVSARRYYTSQGYIECDKEPSQYDSDKGFPPDTKCYFEQAAPTCQDIANAIFMGGGNGELNMKRVYPGLSQSGWVVNDNPGRNAGNGYTSKQFKLKDTNEYTTETRFSWKVSSKEVESYEINIDAGDTWIAYGATNWVPGAVILQGGSDANVYVGTKSSDGPSYPEGDTKSMHFCFRKDHATDGGASGDPHITDWSGKSYDYHGGCDLILLQNKNFASGMGMTIYIRTKVNTWWSSIDTAVIQIGDDTLEVQGGEGAHVWVNRDWKLELQTGDAVLGDFPVHFNRVNDHHTSTRIDLGHGDAISIETFKGFVRVNVHGKSHKAFTGSTGLMGSYPNGDHVGRDGATVFEDNNEFGQEWMVLAHEPKLFHSESAVQGGKCVMPDQSKRQKRRLGETSIGEGQAALACARVSQKDRDACIFDVMATQDTDMAESY